MPQIYPRYQPRMNCCSLRELHSLTCNELWPRPECHHETLFEEDQNRAMSWVGGRFLKFSTRVSILLYQGEIVSPEEDWGVVSGLKKKKKSWNWRTENSISRAASPWRGFRKTQILPLLFLLSLSLQMPHPRRYHSSERGSRGSYHEHYRSRKHKRRRSRSWSSSSDRTRRRRREDSYHVRSRRWGFRKKNSN